MKPYKTLGKEASASFIVNKSEFIGHGSPVRTEQEALDFLARIRQQYRDASHNCFAYIIGKNAGIMRYSDDGEPGGTAGMPILEVLRVRGVVDCCVVVTRYFGGVLLGAGGLTRAYAKGSAAALGASGVVTMEPTRRYWVELPYPLWDRALYYLRQAPCRLEQTDYATSVTATLSVREREAEEVLEGLTRLSDGRVETLLINEGYEAWPDQEAAQAPEGLE